MGFYLRKSIRVGPLRFNFSKSGVGVSSGIRGFRVGSGPRGNYIHIGVGGLYYRTTIPGTASSTETSTSFRSTPIKPSATHAPLEQVTSGCVSKMVDSTSASLLAELNQKRQRLSVWPITTLASLICLVALLVVEASLWLIILVSILLVAGIVFAIQFDQLSKSVVIYYDFDSEMEQAYQRVHDCITQLARCAGKWQIETRGQVYDRKYHAGAGQLVTRRRLSIGVGQPPYLKTNIATAVIPLGSKTLYFLPDRLLVYASDGIGALNYTDLSIRVDATQFIEGESVPHDAQVVGNTWQYVNKNGSPDRRFNNNRQIPICRYDEMWLNSPSGLNEIIQLSRTEVGGQFDKAIQALAELVNQATSAHIPTAIVHEHQQAPASTPVVSDVVPEIIEQLSQFRSTPAEVSERERDSLALLAILCCVMVADGRASTSERERIRQLMVRAQSPWNEAKLDKMITSFINHLKTDGYRKTLDRSLAEVHRFKKNGKQDLLLSCIQSVAGADDKLTDRERQLCQQIKNLVEQ